MNLETFLRNVHGLSRKTDGYVPFLCEGSPLACDILLVGDRGPANCVSFWPHADVSYGFHRAEWLANEMEHACRCISPKERCVVEWMEAAAAPYRILETYITTGSHGHVENPEEAGLLGFILQTVKPRIVAAAGVSTAEFLSLAAATVLPMGNFVEADLGYGPIEIVAMPSLFAGWTESAARVTGSRFRHSLYSRMVKA